MSKKHFIAIARIINDQVNRTDDDHLRAVLYDMADDLCIEFRAANPNFDRNRFMTACGF